MANDSNRSAVDNVKQLRDASKELLDAGNQITENLGELSERVEHAKNVGTRVATSPWFIAGGAIAAGLLVLAFSHHR